MYKRSMTRRDRRRRALETALRILLVGCFAVIVCLLLMTTPAEPTGSNDRAAMVAASQEYDRVMAFCRDKAIAELMAQEVYESLGGERERWDGRGAG